MPKNKNYSMPEKIPKGTLLTDVFERVWRIGKSIGLGGFGEIYSACKDDDAKYDYAVKCEPHENGPLFVEMAFYVRNGKEANLKSYQQKQGLKSFGMPHMIAHGSLTLNGIRHRYILMPRYGQTLKHYFEANGGCLPVGTVYRVAIQMLDVFEYIHQCGYVHADLKASNILLGLGKNGNAQAYLVDFGLASRYFADRDFKPDPKRAHNGTRHLYDATKSFASTYFKVISTLKFKIELIIDTSFEVKNEAIRGVMEVDTELRFIGIANRYLLEMVL